MTPEFDSEVFLKTFEALMEEYNVDKTKPITNIMIQLPKSWEAAKQEIKITGVPFEFVTDNTLEIEVIGANRKFVMKAPPR